LQEVEPNTFGQVYLAIKPVRQNLKDYTFSSQKLTPSANAREREMVRANLTINAAATPSHTLYNVPIASSTFTRFYTER